MFSWFKSRPTPAAAPAVAAALAISPSGIVRTAAAAAELVRAPTTVLTQPAAAAFTVPAPAQNPEPMLATAISSASATAADLLENPWQPTGAAAPVGRRKPPAAGLAVVELRGRRRREGKIVSVRAGGRQVLAVLGADPLPQPFSLGRDGVYRLSGAHPAAAARLDLV